MIVILLSIKELFLIIALSLYASDFANFLPSLLFELKNFAIAILLIFLPALFYYRLGKQNKKDNKLIKSAFILHLIGFLILVVYIILLITLTISVGGFDMFGAAILGIYFIIPMISVFTIGTLLLFINYIKNKKISNKSKRK